MSEKLHVGAAWEETTAGDSARRYYRVAVDVGGVIPSISCRIAENTKPKSERSPSHLMFFSPVNGDDRVVGAFWTQTAKETGAKYLMGSITPRQFGVIELRGGAKLDLRLVDGEVGVKLVASKQEASEDRKNRPTHYLLRTVRIVKKAEAESAPIGDAEEADDADVEEAA